MAMINFADKVALNSNSGIPDINKCNASDMNEIKKAINDLIRPVGSYYETSDTSFDPNITWGGTWELETDGTVLVSKSTTSGSKFDVDVGTVIGEETHELTISEMPRHSHNSNNGATTFENGGANEPSQISGNRAFTYLALPFTGGGQSHNNVQPSKVINRWHRTA